MQRGEKMTMENQRKNIRCGMASLQNIVNENTITLVHGNGPQVGLLLLESAAYEKQTGLSQMSLDVLDAETEGMIGYMIEQELHSLVNEDRGMVTVLSQIVVDPEDPSFQNPTKFVGPVYTEEEANKLGLSVKPDGEFFRRVVPSPRPVKLVEHQMHVLRQLIAMDTIVIRGGGGGIPIVVDPKTHKYHGIEAVIDKDRSAAMLGRDLGAKGLLVLTDVPAVATDYGTPNQRLIRSATPTALQDLMKHFPDGSMGPKIEAAIDFVTATKGWASIGALNEADKIIARKAGTSIFNAIDGNKDTLLYYDKESFNAV